MYGSLLLTTRRSNRIRAIIMLPVRRRRRRRLPVVMPIVVVCWCLRIAGSCAWRSHSLVLPTRTRRVPKHRDGTLCAKKSDRTTNTNTEDDDGYQFGNITKGMLGKFQTEVNSLTGKSHYKFGTSPPQTPRCCIDLAVPVERMDAHGLPGDYSRIILA